MVVYLRKRKKEWSGAACFYSSPQKHFLLVYLDIFYPADQRPFLQRKKLEIRMERDRREILASRKFVY